MILKRLITPLILYSLLTYPTLNATTTLISLKNLFDKVNEIRANPQAQADIIKTKILDKINDNGVHSEWFLKYHEGKVAIQEAIEYLKTKEPVGALVLDEGLTRSAWEHSRYQIEVAKAMTHSGPNGEELGDRVRKYNKWTTGYIYENIVSSGSIWNTAELVCYAWIIDDGVTSRGHRTNFFSETTKMGLGIYNYDSGKKDRITQVFVTNGVSDCNKCGEFTPAQKKETCWTSFQEGSESCDVDTTGMEGATGGDNNGSTGGSNSGNTGGSTSGNTGGSNNGAKTQEEIEEEEKIEKRKKTVNYSCKGCCGVCSCCCIILFILKFKSLLVC